MKIPLLRELLLLGYRSLIGLRYVASVLGSVVRWVFRSKETTNFTYYLTPASKAYMTAFVATVTGQSEQQITAYIQEIDQNEALKNHIRTLTAQSAERYKADSEVMFGKRMGWYAFIRATKPKVVIETGVDKGLGSCVICAALLQNAKEGHQGRYYGTDINPKAGYLLQEPYRTYGEILYGDSIESLNAFGQSIDIFINDSDHSADYEAREYLAIQHKLSPKGYILGDNCEVTTKLHEFAQANQYQFLFFREEPQNHWFPGGGIGVAYRKGLV